MALWLSNPKDDGEGTDQEDWAMATRTSVADTQIGDVQGEGENGDFNELLEQVNEADSQPIPQPAKPKLKPKEVKWTDDDLPAAEAEIVDSPTMLQVEENTLNEKVLLVQPEEQEYRGKAASSSGAGEANDANQETATATNETKGRREVNPETAE